LMTPRFLADEMNGDIAKWLRIMGFDCKYLTGRDLDDRLVEICLREDRVLLTSDRELYLKAVGRGVKAILTIGGDRKEKLRKIIKSMGLEDLVFKAYRCPMCNSLLDRVESSKVRDRLPRGVAERHRFVWLCPSCGKVYWEGTHWSNILRFVGEVVK